MAVEYKKTKKGFKAEEPENIEVKEVENDKRNISTN